MRGKTEGFTLLELMVAVAVLSLLTALTTPYFLDWRRSARHKAAARAVASVLREARSRAVTNNVEYEVEFDLNRARYCLKEGNRAEGSTVWSAASEWVDFPAGVFIGSGEDCANLPDPANTVKKANIIQFNPNGTGGSKGTANSHYICILDNGYEKIFRAGIWSSTTGRVVIHRWNAADHEWR